MNNCHTVIHEAVMPLLGILLALVLPMDAGSAIAVSGDPTVPPSPPQDAHLLHTARALVRIHLVGRECALLFAVDQGKVQEIGRSLFTEGLDRFGRQKLRQAVDAVEDEFTGPLADEGADLWCPAQRNIFEGLGFPGLIGEQRP